MTTLLKRVPLSFKLKLNTLWKGYTNPHCKTKKCAACRGSGSSPEAQHLKDLWYGNVPFKPEDRGSTPFTIDHHMVRERALRNITRSPQYQSSEDFKEYKIRREAQRLVDLFNSAWCYHVNADDVAALLAHDRLMDLTHVWTRETGWVNKDPDYVPSPEEVNNWSINSLGHDCIGSHCIITAECKRLSVERNCSVCDGGGYVWASDAINNKAEQWKPTEPPLGAGYQAWIVEADGGYPISPVFSSPRELATHMSSKEERIDGNRVSSLKVWLEFIEQLTTEAFASE